MHGAGLRTDVAAYCGLCQLSNEIKDDGEAVCKVLRKKGKKQKTRMGCCGDIRAKRLKYSVTRENALLLGSVISSLLRTLSAGFITAEILDF